MNLFTRPPSRPYRNMFVAALIGVPIGSLLVSLHVALDEATTPADALTFMADAVFVAFFGYAIVALLLLVYGLPALWLALRFRLAGPAIALSVATLPGLSVLLSEGALQNSILLIPAAISLATGVAFVVLAYRALTGELDWVGPVPKRPPMTVIGTVTHDLKSRAHRLRSRSCPKEVITTPAVDWDATLPPDCGTNARGGVGSVPKRPPITVIGTVTHDPNRKRAAGVRGHAQHASA